MDLFCVSDMPLPTLAVWKGAMDKDANWQAGTIITVAFWEAGYTSDTSLAEIAGERLLPYLICDHEFLHCLQLLFWTSTLEFLHWVTTRKQKPVTHAQSPVKPHICSFQERKTVAGEGPPPSGKLGWSSMTGHLC